MLSMIAVVLGGFVLLVRASYRRDRRLREQGAGYAPEGRVRWDASGIVEPDASRRG